MKRYYIPRPTEDRAIRSIEKQERQNPVLSMEWIRNHRPDKVPVVGPLVPQQTMKDQRNRSR